MQEDNYPDYDGGSDAAIPPMQQTQQAASMLPLLGSIPYQQSKQAEGMLNQHLGSEKIIEKLKMRLLNYEWNEEEGKWEKATREINIDGRMVRIEEPPLMSPSEVKTTIAYLEMMLNSNLFLSNLERERVNNIMVELNFKLMTVFYRLRRKMTPEERELIWGMLEYPILFGLSRAQNKITLDAVSKSQHTIESIQLGDRKQQQQDTAPKGPMKLFGF